MWDSRAELKEEGGGAVGWAWVLEPSVILTPWATAEAANGTQSCSWPVLWRGTLDCWDFCRAQRSLHPFLPLRCFRASPLHRSSDSPNTIKGQIGLIPPERSSNLPKVTQHVEAKPRIKTRLRFQPLFGVTRKASAEGLYWAGGRKLRGLHHLQKSYPTFFCKYTVWLQTQRNSISAH